MKENENTGHSPVVSRSLAPRAPGNSVFRSVACMEHEWFCEQDVRFTECSCGLWQSRLVVGDFVLYDASMCQVNSADSGDLTHPPKEKNLPAIENLNLFIELLVAKTARLDMARFNRED